MVEHRTSADEEQHGFKGLGLLELRDSKRG